MSDIMILLYFTEKSQIRMRPFDPADNLQAWVIRADRIQNLTDEKLVLGCKKKAKIGATISAAKDNGDKWQKWTFDIAQ